ncbi:MAG TPA: uracil-DNA glycosylase [Coriobacteriia bacterium]
MAVGGRGFGSLDELREYMAECERCPLGCSRRNLVFGVGDPHAELMFIGEAPGEREDILGEPFVGAAGKLLDELLGSIGLVRAQVYIANVLKCRPPGNRDPLPEEIAECAPFLAEQIRLIDPKVIATLGNFATKFVLRTQRGITSLRGKLYHVDGRQVVPIFHPAAALHNPANRQALFDDFRRLRTVIERTPEETLAACAQGDEVEPAGERAPRVVECETPRLFDPK